MTAGAGPRHGSNGRSLAGRSLAGRSLAGRSLRGRGLRILAGASVIFVAASAFAVTGLVSARHGRDDLLERLDPAIEHADDYRSALVDQETGARGFALSQNTAFLQPYQNGLAQAAGASRALAVEIRGLGGGVPAELDRITRQVTAWHARYLTPLLAGRQARAPDSASLAAAERAFDGIRASFVTLEAQLAHQRARAASGFDRAYWTLVGVVSGALALVVVIAILIGLTLRREVMAPLLALGTDSRRVADGDLEHPVARTGPQEIADLAVDIDAMRARIVADLRAIETARADLERREVDLVRSNRDLEQFAYVASHDLQEPLRKVASFCQLLAARYRDELDDRGVQYIDFAVDGAKRMQALVNDLLAFSRVGRNADSWQPVDLRAAAEAATTNLESRLADTGGRIEYTTALPTVEGDAGLLTALWQNLLGNSLKFHGDEPPVITVGARPEREGWEITVTDNGIGVEPQYAERVFVIFQRLHTRERYEGTGIGLALCRKIVEFHGGEIGLEPATTGSGATVRFWLPASPPAALSPRSEEARRVPS
jgi:signal transduction histidine kinase